MGSVQQFSSFQKEKKSKKGKLLKLQIKHHLQLMCRLYSAVVYINSSNL